MRSFVLYTAARVVLFAATFGLVWLAFGSWLTWDAVSILYTAIIAMVVSSVIALFALGSLRNSLAADVSARADRAKAAYDAMRAAEDEPAGVPGNDPEPRAVDDATPRTVDDVPEPSAGRDDSGHSSTPS